MITSANNSTFLLGRSVVEFAACQAAQLEARHSLPGGVLFSWSNDMRWYLSPEVMILEIVIGGIACVILAVFINGCT
jgi:hypothetical protein